MRRFEKFFTILKNKGIEIHVRSVFLQGLFFIKPERLPDFFKPVKTKLTYLHNIVKKKNICLSHLLLGFVISNLWVDKVIIGVDSYDQFKENVNIDFSWYTKILVELDIDELSVKDEKILIPSKWEVNFT